MASIIPFLPAIASAGVSIFSGLANRKKDTTPKETKNQATQRHLIDQLLNSLKGNGPYSDLFTTNEADFNKSFREPAMSHFRNQMAPQIQQQHIFSGQQGGTGMQDTLARAGVDMDNLINQHYMSYRQGAMNRKSNAIGQVLGQGPGAAEAQGNQSMGEAAMKGLTGYMGGEGWENNLAQILSSFNKPKQPDSSPEQSPLRKGFEPEPTQYKHYQGYNPFGVNS